MGLSDPSKCTGCRGEERAQLRFSVHRMPTREIRQCTNSVECEACPLGKYAHSEGNSECTACERGRYNDVESQSVGCEECVSGQFSVDTGATQCTLCPEGMHGDTKGSETCKNVGWKVFYA